MSYLKQSTASQVVPLGPFLDEIDGNTEETGLTIANTDIKINKAGAAAVDKNAGGATHDQGGIYLATFDATDTDTLGTFDVNVHVAGALYVQKRLTVLPANVYDAIVAGTDNLEVDIISMLGAAGTSLPSTQASVDTVDGNVDSILVDTGTTIPAQISALNDISPAEVGTEVDSSIASAGLSTFDNTTDQVIVVTNNDKTGYSISGGVDVISINGSTDAAERLAETVVLAIKGTASGAGTTTSMPTSLVSQATDFWKGRTVLFQGGALGNSAVAITASSGSTLTFEGGASSAVASGQAFIIV